MKTAPNLYGTWPSQIAKFMGPTWSPPGSCRPQMGPMLAPWTLLSGSSPCLSGDKRCYIIGNVRRYLYEERNSPTTKQTDRLATSRPFLSIVCLMVVTRYVYCITWVMRIIIVFNRRKDSMVIPDDIAPIWRQDICNDHDGECLLVCLRSISAQWAESLRKNQVCLYFKLPCRSLIIWTLIHFIWSRVILWFLRWRDSSIAALTHWGRYKMVVISQTILSSAFSWMKM